MLERIFKYFIAFFIILIFFGFFPYFPYEIYLDSTYTFGSLSVFKILILNILNCLLIIYLIIKIFRDKININLNLCDYIIFFLLITNTFGLFFAKDFIISLFGFNGNLQNSFIEIASLLFFALLFSNYLKINLKRKNFFLYLLSFVGVILSLFVLLIYSINNEYLFYPLNLLGFSFLGNINSNLAVLFVSFFITLGLLFAELTKKKSAQFYLLFINVFVIGLGLGIEINLYSANPKFVFMTFFIFIIISSFLHILNQKNIVNYRFISLLFPILGFIIGIFISISFLININQPYFYSKSGLIESDGILINQINEGKNILFGYGHGFFGVLNDSFTPRNEIISSFDNGLIVKNFSESDDSLKNFEMRVFASQKLINGIFIDTGILGSLGFFGLFILVLISFIKNRAIKSDSINFFVFFALLFWFFSIFILPYDFILFFVFFLVLAVWFAERDFEVLFLRDFSQARNLAKYLTPLTLVPIMFFIFLNINILTANLFLFEYFNEKSVGNNEVANQKIQKSKEIFPYSSLIKREALLSQQEIKIEDINKLINQFPNDYKNNYLKVLYLLNNQDTFSRQEIIYAANETIRKNLHHPETYVILAEIYFQEGETNSALNQLNRALIYDSDNIDYLVLKSQIYEKSNDYQNALNIYNFILNYQNEFLEKSPNNQEIQSSIELLNKKIEEIEQKINI
jgi:tetratricopeptide (TPR) repeat protein